MTAVLPLRRDSTSCKEYRKRFSGKKPDEARAESGHARSVNKRGHISEESEIKSLDFYAMIFAIDRKVFRH